MAFCAIAAAGGACAQTLWDDAAFALYQQAVEAINKKDYEGADRLAAEAIQQYPTHVLAYYVRGQAAIAQSKWEAAAVALGKVVDLYPGSFAGQRDLGLAYQQLGKTDEAARAYAAALSLRQDDDLAVRLAFMLLKANQSDRAQPLLQQLADRDSKVTEVWTALGRIAYDKGNLAATEKSLTRAVALRDDGRTWFNLGVVRLRQSDVQGALDAFDHAADHPETREQAAREIDKLRAGADRGNAREAQKPGNTTPAPATRRP